MSLKKDWQICGGGNRKTPCINCALGAKNDEIEFAESVGQYGVASAHRSLIKEEEIKTVYKIKQYRLADILRERQIKKIDFISIDVEGYEFEVLEGIDYEAVDIKCFVIENDENGYPRLGLREYMKKKGYQFVGRIMIDDIFLKEGLNAKN